jgi:hypothetical protein
MVSILERFNCLTESIGRRAMIGLSSLGENRVKLSWVWATRAINSTVR